MNEDEALKCLDIAKKAINNSQFDKAEKFLVKSIKLHETPNAQILLNRLDKYRQAAAQQNSQSTKTASSSTSSRAAPGPQKPETPVDDRKFTAEDAKVCNDILKQKDYYAVMGVSKDCTDNDLKKAFKKRAIKVHPDKNPHPKATDAFKKVNAAMACLSDAKKRREYDQVGGSEEAFQRHEQGMGGRRPRNDFQHEFFQAEDIFQQFFGGNFGQQFEQPRQRRHQPRNQYHQQQDQYEQVDPMQMIRNVFPLLLIFFASILLNGAAMNFGGNSAPSVNYSFQQTYHYREKLTSYRIGQVYYVTPYTLQTFQGQHGSKQKYDEKVEQDLINRLDNSCREQKSQKKAYEDQAKRLRYGSQKQIFYQEKAAKIDLQSCKSANEARNRIDDYNKNVKSAQKENKNPSYANSKYANTNYSKGRKP